MTSTCAVRHLGSGWLTWIWTREVPVDGPPQRWTRTGFSCQIPADAVTNGRPALTRALIQHAFTQLPFTPPAVHIQPEGNVTLVNLPTYYQVRWPAAGYQPGETATISLLGRTIRIKPSATYTYQFGDGTSTGPTPDPGGTYPRGQIRHTYRTDTNAAVHIQAHYTGQYTLNGTWQDIDITVPINGPATTLEIKQAHAHLITGER